MVHFGEFMKTWSLRSNSVARQVTSTRIGWKCQNGKNSNATFWEIFKHYALAKNSFNYGLASAKITCDSCQTKCIYVFVVAVVLSLLGIDPKGESKSFSHSKSDAGEKKNCKKIWDLDPWSEKGRDIINIIFSHEIP